MSARHANDPRATFAVFAVIAVVAGVPARAQGAPASMVANAGPLVLAQELTAMEDTPLQGVLVATDPDGDALKFTLVSKAKRGVVTLDARTGALQFTPSKDAHGDDSFLFAVSDGRLKATCTATIHITAVDDPPVARPLSLLLYEDRVARGALAARDVDGDALLYALDAARAPAHGTVAIDAVSGALSYTPAPDFHGTDAFAVDVSAGAAHVSAAVSVTVTPLNDAPLSQASELSVAEDGVVEGALVASDIDGDALAYALDPTQAPRHGHVTIAPSGAVRYQPAKDWHGDDAFRFVVSDGKLRSTATVTVHVTPENDLPTARSLSLTTVEDAPVRARVIAVDVDGDALAYALDAARAPAHGTVAIDATSGALSYTPTPDFHGTDGFAVDVSAGGAHVNAAVSVTVAPQNDPPLAQAGELSVAEDGVVEGALAASDVDGDTLAFKVATSPKRGSVTVDAGTGALSYRPFRDLHGDDRFTFAASDRSRSSAATVVVHVSASNDAPVTRAVALNTREDVAAPGTVPAFDVDNDALAFRVSGGPAHGEVALDEKSGAFTFTPSPDVNGVDGFSVEVSDGSAVATSQVSVTVAAVPDVARVKQGVVMEALEDTPVSGRLPAADADGDALVFKIVTPPRLGTAVLEDAASGAWRYTPRAESSGVDEVVFEASGGGGRVRGTVQVRIVAQNDPPRLADLELSAREDTEVAGALTATDIDGDALRFAVAAAPTRGRVTIDGATVRYQPARDDHGDVAFTVTASDGSARSAPARVVVHVTPVNDAPLVTDQAMTTLEDEPVDGKVVVTDVDNDRLVFRVQRAPTRGKVAIIDPAAGTFRYAPERNLFGPDWFSIEAVDPHAAIGVATVRMDVVAIDDPPVGRSGAVLAPRSGRVTGKLDGYDPEGRSVTYQLHTAPRFGRVEITDEHTGSYELTTDGVVGSTFFLFTVSDGQLTSAPAKVDINTRR